MSYYGGIDPGKHGFVSVIDDSGALVESHPQPKLSNAAGDQFDIPAMNQIVLNWKTMGVKLVVVELTQPQGKLRSSAKTGFMQAAPYFIWRALLLAHGVPHQLVKDSVWKKTVGVIVPTRKGSHSEHSKRVKAESIKSTQSLFPGVDLRRTPRCHGPDDNKCESMLMALAAQRIDRGAALPPEGPSPPAIPCSECGAQAGEPCLGKRTGRPVKTIHECRKGCKG